MKISQLDTMTPKELRAFWFKHIGTSPDLAHYASNRATMLDARQRATHHENVCANLATDLATTMKATTMKATISPLTSRVTPSQCNRVDNPTRTLKLVAFSAKAIHVPVSVTWTAGATTHCVVRVTLRSGDTMSGYGKATGGGYCKYSASFESACNAAGITFSDSVHGAGMSVVEDAMTAIGSSAGFRQSIQRFIAT